MLVGSDRTQRQACVERECASRATNRIPTCQDTVNECCNGPMEFSLTAFPRIVSMRSRSIPQDTHDLFFRKNFAVIQGEQE